MQGFFEATHVPVGVSRHCPALLNTGSHSIPVSQGCVLTVNGLRGQELAGKFSPGSALGVPVWAASPAGHRALGCPVNGTSAGWDAGPQGMGWDTGMQQAFMGWDVQMWGASPRGDTGMQGSICGLGSEAAQSIHRMGCRDAGSIIVPSGAAPGPGAVRGPVRHGAGVWGRLVTGPGTSPHQLPQQRGRSHREG